MYFWNVESLKRELVLGSTPEQSFRYLLALVLAPEVIDFAFSLGFACLAWAIDFDSVAETHLVAAGRVEEHLAVETVRALLSVAVWFVGLLSLFRVFRKEIVRYLGWLLIPYGTKSLSFYILHALTLPFIVTSLTISSSALINTVVGIGVLLGIWALMKIPYIKHSLPR